ncbi:neutral ceramidase-like [Tribolium madens]|uniref:neutral ceramidase-like n=1 Tax=Tribolium madens TaxID=41895 RepID=UPI001CF74B0A|nr:neutral ceramidase-like [Tribolium madens]
MQVNLRSILVFVFFLKNGLVQSEYQIGIGRADCTGPPAEIIFMGYAKLSQVGCGLHLRQFSRAFIIDDGLSRVAFVTVDSQSMAHGVRRQVLKNLAGLYNDTYTEQNLIISGTHTHSTPGGWLMDLMFDIPNLGFVQESFDTLVEGITQSIINAHENMVKGKIYVNSGILLEANINRSPASYLYNPEEERAKYEHNVDKEMVQIKFIRSSDNEPIGAINWFAVHPTSMNNTNCLVTSDNVGYASIQLESYVNNETLPGKGQFVGAFASTNLGDVSPNTKGPICIDTGEECDFVTSTCNGNAQTCKEYQLQRYEGGSTIYGPQTLNLYINKFKQLATALINGKTLDPGPTPPDFSSQLITLVSPPSVDGIAESDNFGDCLQQPPASVSLGETVSVKFVSGNPRHDVLHGSTYISVEQSVGDNWVLVASDANWETRFYWKRTNPTTGESEVTIEWDIGQNVEPGQYRIRHNGHYKEKSGEIRAYEGVTKTFNIA